MMHKKEPVTKIIDDEEYTFYYLSPRISYPLAIKIAKIVAPALGSMLDSTKNNPGLQEKLDINDEKEALENLLDSTINLEKVISLLCANINEDEVQGIIDALFNQIIHKGKGHVIKAYDALFTGRLLHLTKVLSAAIGVQLGDFLAGKSAMENMKSVVDIAQGSQI